MLVFLISSECRGNTGTVCACVLLPVIIFIILPRLIGCDKLPDGNDQTEHDGDRSLDDKTGAQHKMRGEEIERSEQQDQKDRCADACPDKFPFGESLL